MIQITHESNDFHNYDDCLHAISTELDTRLLCAQIIHYNNFLTKDQKVKKT